MDSSDGRRLSVSVVDVISGQEAEFLTLATHFEALLLRKDYGRAEMIRDEAHPLRFYSVRYWTDADRRRACHRDQEVQALTAQLYHVARVTHVVNGVRRNDQMRLLLDDRRARDRGRSADRLRSPHRGRRAHRRRTPREARAAAGPRRVRETGGEVDLVGAARRAREHADAAYSHFKVGAALETVDGTVITGCNIENATYGLTMCAERVAMFKALSEGHRVFTRIAIVADTDAPTPPCGACRQILWEFAGDLEILLANLTDDTGTHHLEDLLPHPFDARLLESS